MKNAFTDHPASVGETYVEHLGMASGFGGKMVLAGFACMLHAIFPFLFKCTGRRCIEQLHHQMVTHRNRHVCEDSEMPVHAPAEHMLKAAE